MKCKQACLAVVWVSIIMGMATLGGCSGSEPKSSVPEQAEVDLVSDAENTARTNISGTTSESSASNEPEEPASESMSESDSSEKSNAETAGVVATVFSIVQTDAEIAFDVLSNGCTQTTDFQIVYGEPRNGDIPVTLMRLRQDPCKKMPELVSIQLPIDIGKVGQHQLVVTNDLSEFPVIKRQ